MNDGSSTQNELKRNGYRGYYKKRCGRGYGGPQVLSIRNCSSGKIAESVLHQEMRLLEISALASLSFLCVSFLSQTLVHLNTPAAG